MDLHPYDRKRLERAIDLAVTSAAETAYAIEGGTLMVELPRAREAILRAVEEALSK